MRRRDLRPVRRPRADTGVRLRLSSQAIPASAAICSGQPMAILLTASAAIIAAASSAARPAR